jgi:FkbM family methyltransferase
MTAEFLYISQNKILVSEDCLKPNSEWVHSSVYPHSPDFVWELNAIQRFVDEIQDGFSILDIGAKTGCFSLAAKYYPNTKWHSFEPDPFSHSILQKNIELNKIENVTLYTEALSNKVGTSFLNIFPEHRGLNTIGDNPTRFAKDQSIQYKVEVNTIDNLFLETKIDLIKIDTEGSEYDILQGGIETIRKYRPKILFEFNEENLGQCNHTIWELDTLISELNYEVFWHDNSENVFIQSK